MDTHISPVDPHSALRPLLLCLATAAASKRSPPPLIPLLTPINKQRVKLLVSDEDSTWLQLLSSRAADQWDRLIEIVGRDVYEPHPVSGEIELSFVTNPQYYRLDQETLKAKVTVPDLEITVIYLWCDDADPGPERIPNKWRVHEILPGTNADKDPRWEITLERAEEVYQRKSGESHFAGFTQGVKSSTSERQSDKDDSDDSDDSYWNQYDKTPEERRPSPGEASAHVQSRAPINPSMVDESAKREIAYFERYNDVQPALDNDVPDPKANEAAPSQHEEPNHRQIMYSGATVASAVRDAKIGPLTVVNRSPGEVDIDDESDDEITEPKPSSMTTTTEQTSAGGLEPAVVLQSNGEFAIRQHIGSSIRSMFNLWRSTGLDRTDFENLVSTEVASLSMYDQEA